MLAVGWTTFADIYCDIENSSLDEPRALCTKAFRDGRSHFNTSLSPPFFLKKSPATGGLTGGREVFYKCRSHDIRSDLYDIHTQHLLHDWSHIVVLVFCQTATENGVILFGCELTVLFSKRIITVVVCSQYNKVPYSLCILWNIHGRSLPPSLFCDSFASHALGFAACSVGLKKLLYVILNFHIALNFNE